MSSALDLAAANLLSPMVLFFALGLMAAMAKSDLEIPQAVAKTLALYLMIAIGLKGGAGVAQYGIDLTLVASLLAGIVLSFVMPVIAFAFLRATSSLPKIDAAAVSAHYGSISVVTFAVAIDQLTSLDIPYEGYLVAVAAAMETPAIISGLLLARRGAAGGERPAGSATEQVREVIFNGSIVVLVGAFVIGWITGADGEAAMAPFITDPFKGVLALFLLDMGIVAGRGLRSGLKDMRLPVILFGVYMPVIGAALGAVASSLLGLSVGGTALLMTLSASASYIAVPAAIRLALPEARPAVYLTLSLGITFPFNLALGVPLYIAAARMIAN